MGHATLNLDSDVLALACRLFATDSPSVAVNAALREVVRVRTSEASTPSTTSSSTWSTAVYARGEMAELETGPPCIVAHGSLELTRERRFRVAALSGCAARR